MTSSKNYEQMYNDLKKEYEQSKKANDDIIKELEDLCEDSDKKLEESIKRQKQLEKEVENYKAKNKDKMKDNEELYNKIDKLQQKLSEIQSAKSLIESKIVTLENDNYYYLSHNRELIAQNEDLNNQLEEAIEENIFLQTEFETYKQISKEESLRKDQDLREAKNEVYIKEKIIMRLSKKNNVNLPHQGSHKRMVSSKTITLNSNGKIQNINTYNKNNPINSSGNSGRAKQGNEDIGSMRKTSILLRKGSAPLDHNSAFTTEPQAMVQKKNDSVKELTDMVIQSKIEEKRNTENSDFKTPKHTTNNNEQRNFNNVEIDSGDNFEIIHVNQISNNLIINEKLKSLNKEMKKKDEMLKEMLSKVQSRKQYLKEHKKILHEKLEKMGVKIR